MWVFDKERNKWYKNTDELTFENFESLKRDFDEFRLYSKCLSSAVYYPVNDLEDIYNILNYDTQKTWFVNTTYSVTPYPTKNPSPISHTTSNEYYNKYIKEYGFTLKNLFTPERLINDSLKNFIYVDLATTEEINNLEDIIRELYIDGIKVREGHRILVKDQKTYVTLSNNVDPNSYFYPTPFYKDKNQPHGSTETTYYYYNEKNGIYKYTGNKLIKENDLDDYDTCVRYSVCVKMGNTNKDKQFHLRRMMNGYYPTTSENNPIEFKEKHNWIIRNRLDYNNILDINYYDVLKHPTHSYYDINKNFTYSIPERTIGIGEFGIIINYQNNVAHIINNKHKINLKSIHQTNGYYWICGDNGTLLKVSKVDFKIEKIKLETYSNLKSIAFFNDLRGVVVGDHNTIYITNDGGKNWKKIHVEEFNSYNYNKVLFYNIGHFFVAGDTGVFLEFKQILNEWKINKKRISKYLNGEEFLLVEDINDLILLVSDSTNPWNLSYIDSTQAIPSNKESIVLVTNNSNIILYNLNNYVEHSFIFFEFPVNYGDINSITYKENTNELYFSSDKIYSFDINIFEKIYLTNSNIIHSSNNATASTVYNIYVNKIKNYNDTELLFCGNKSILNGVTYSTPINNNFIDANFKNKLKSKLLFLNYDIAAKVNFFDDDQNYILPNSLTFSGSDFGINSYLSLKSFNNKDWLTHFKDKEKTFEYYTGLNDSNMVFISTTFSHSTYSTYITYSSSQLTIDYNSISNLAPRIKEKGHSRYIDGPTPITPPSVNFDIYMYDYLMVLKTTTQSSISVGDVIRLESDVVDGNFIVNKIVTFGSHNYNYMYTDFNQNILNELKNTTQPIKIFNLNKYNTLEDLIEKFNKHPVSYGYNLTYSLENDIVTLFPVLTNKSAYYNLSAIAELNNNMYYIEYDNDYLNFGFTPKYNILSYLSNINPSVFDPNNKEFLAMPLYQYIPCDSGSSGISSDKIYLDTNIGFINSPGGHWLNPNKPPLNKLIFGSDLKLQWETLLIYTFVDLYLIDDNYDSHRCERLLIIKKYEDFIDNQKVYVIEFHKAINYPLYSNIQYITISSRRKLTYISIDLKELDNIQNNFSLNILDQNNIYESYDGNLNFKIPTDSYAKVLLSDADIKNNLTGIIYTDYKNELCLNIINLEKEYEIPIISTTNYTVNSNNYLYIYCSEKHGLNEGDGVVLEFNGGEGSSQTLNPHYFGFHTVGTIPGNEYDFFVYTNFGVPYISSNDTGVVKITKKDPFLNYQPVDLIDLGVDKKTKISITLEPENTILDDFKHKLINVDFKRYRFKLYDGLTLNYLIENFPWILEAEISDALLGLDENQNLIWYNGIWHCGRWFGKSKNGKKAIWVSGIWVSGDWYGGVWKSNSIEIKLNHIEIKNVSDKRNSIWLTGRWFDGKWENGIWYYGRWYNGIWNNGEWYNGYFKGGIWVMGEWYKGIFNTHNKPAYWLYGHWYGGDFENGIWYNGVLDEKNNNKSRFGTKSSNTRPSIWESGIFVSGEFHSRLNLNDFNEITPSEDHKLSVWKTGIFLFGDWYGGIAYNIDFRSGIWHNGILEDIQIIGVNTQDNTFDLNGLFRFNIGDEIAVIGDIPDTNIYYAFGSNTNPKIYKILNVILLQNGNKTKITVDKNLSNMINTNLIITDADLGIRVVSRFKNTNWMCGICTNGIFEDCNWFGGIFYNGIFNNGNWF